jgi:hypothetical protein
MGVFSICSHGLFAGLVMASRLPDAAGLAMFPQGSLADSGLSCDCEAILYQSINCRDDDSALVATGYLNGDEPAVLKLVEKVPSPTQPGMVDSCNKWHYVDDGDGCYSIAQTYRISLSDFYSWNSKVGTDCAGLWLHYYVCVGIRS